MTMFSVIHLPFPITSQINFVVRLFFFSVSVILLSCQEDIQVFQSSWGTKFLLYADQLMTRTKLILSFDSKGT